MNLYVGNLAYSVTDFELREAFAPFGELVSIKVITDKHTGQSRGFGFVEFASLEAAQNAMAQMQGKPIGNRKVTINEARPSENRAPQRSFNNRRAPRHEYNPLLQQSVERQYN